MLVATSAFAVGAVHFEEWRRAHGVAYRTTEETLHRRAIFESNQQIIEGHNAGDHSWSMGTNQFSDLTAAEFSARRPSKLMPMKASSRRDEWLTEVPTTNDVIDWRIKGAVTPVKDQGGCGS